MIKKALKKLVISKFSSIEKYNQHKSEPEVRDGLNLVPLEGIFKALGVHYNLAENGYICLGKLFGGLIIQWGLANTIKGSTVDIKYPIAFPSKLYVLLRHPLQGDYNTNITYDEIIPIDVTEQGFKATTTSPPTKFNYLVIGR